MLAVTMGDPGGIGPEIVCKALAPAARRDRGWAPARFRVHGSHAAMLHAADACGIEPYWWLITRGSDLAEAASRQDVVLIDSDPDIERATGRPAREYAETGPGPFPNRPDRLGGELSLRWVLDAVADCGGAPSPDAPGRNGTPPGRAVHADETPIAHGIVTAPISKEAWNLAVGTKGSRWPGHTELLADRFGARRVLMMFEGPALRVALATIHLPLMDVRDVLTIGRVFDAIDLAAAGCTHLGIPSPRIAVCGLNPHAGEGDLLGDEESRLIKPAIRLARDAGIDASGPHPADTVFHRALRGRFVGEGAVGARPDEPTRPHRRPDFDLVVAMYHDQGLIPVKLLARDESVNMSVGLPVVRTSPDHGTAFDIAGRNAAHPGSMIASVATALRVARAPAALSSPAEP